MCTYIRACVYFQETVMCNCIHTYRWPTWRVRALIASTSSTVRNQTANSTLACSHCSTLSLRPTWAHQAGSGRGPTFLTTKTTLFHPLVMGIQGIHQPRKRATRSLSLLCFHMQRTSATLPTTIPTPTPCCKYVLSL